MVGSIWSFLQDENNRVVLAWIGGENNLKAAPSAVYDHLGERHRARVDEAAKVSKHAARAQAGTRSSCSKFSTSNRR